MPVDGVLYFRSFNIGLTHEGIHEPGREERAIGDACLGGAG